MTTFSTCLNRSCKKSGMPSHCAPYVAHSPSWASKAKGGTNMEQQVGEHSLSDISLYIPRTQMTSVLLGKKRCFEGLWYIYPIPIAFEVQGFWKICWLELYWNEFSPSGFENVLTWFILLRAWLHCNFFLLLQQTKEMEDEMVASKGSPRAPPHLLVHWHHPWRFPTMSNSRGGNKQSCHVISL